MGQIIEGGMTEYEGFHYWSEEEEFVKYFNRLRGSGYSWKDIEKNLTHLSKYYNDMVIYNGINTRQYWWKDFSINGLYKSYKEYHN